MRTSIHNIARTFAIASVVATAIRWFQFHIGRGGYYHWVAIIPEWLILLFVLLGLLYAPVSVLAGISAKLSGLDTREYWVDLTFIAAAWLSFLLYLRYA
jgi:hypothetical protein